MERSPEAGTALLFMPSHPHETVAAIADTLTDDGLACRVCADAEALERHLTDPAAEIGAVVVSQPALQNRVQEILKRFQEQEPGWSSLPLVLLTPDEEEGYPALKNVVLLQEPTPWRELRTVMRISLGFRARQRDLARLHQRLERMALGDPLTGLPNRTALFQHLVALQRGRRGEDHAFTVIFLDLNDFKSINDAYGHAAGDEALRQVAQHLQGTVRADDFVARFAGDEFIAVLTGVDCDERAADAAIRLSQGVPVRLGPHVEPLTISASAGIVEGIEADATPDGILARADAHMYAHKRASRRTPPWD